MTNKTLDWNVRTLSVASYFLINLRFRLWRSVSEFSRAHLYTENSNSHVWILGNSSQPNNMFQYEQKLMKRREKRKTCTTQHCIVARCILRPRPQLTRGNGIIVIVGYQFIDCTICLFHWVIPLNYFIKLNFQVSPTPLNYFYYYYKFLLSLRILCRNYFTSMWSLYYL